MGRHLPTVPDTHTSFSSGSGFTCAPSFESKKWWSRYCCLVIAQGPSKAIFCFVSQGRERRGRELMAKEMYVIHVSQSIRIRRVLTIKYVVVSVGYVG